MGFLKKILGSKSQSPNEDISYALEIVKAVGMKIGSRYTQNNAVKYLALYGAGEFMRDSMESGDFETYSSNYKGTKQQGLVRHYINQGIDNLVRNGLPASSAEQHFRSRLEDLETMTVDALTTFVKVNREKNPSPAAFFTALRVFYDHAETEMRKGFRNS